MVRIAARVGLALIVVGSVAGGVPVQAQPIVPDRVFPPVPEAGPPAAVLAMPLYLKTDAIRPTYQRTNLTLAAYLAVLPPGGTWRRVRSGDGWLLHLDRLDVSGWTLEDVVILFDKDNRAAEYAGAYLHTRIQGRALSPAQSYALARAILDIAQNGT
jgi:hypothetical protein